MKQQATLERSEQVIPFRRAVETFQTTPGSPVAVSGRGLFHGIQGTVRLLPAAENTGIIFRRVDLHGHPEVAAQVENVAAAPRRTVLSANGARVETIEHLMAALGGLQVDNCIIEIDCPEVPAMDGSCLPFCEALLESGIQSLTAPRRVFRIREAHAAAGEGGERIEVTPLYASATSICYQLNYGSGSPIPECSLTVNVSPDEFMQEIAGARTFVLEDEIEQLRQMGYGRHLTARDILVFNADGTITDNELRWPDEPVRHKILDCIGDLALCGTDFVAQVIARRTGHKLNHVMASVVSMISGRGITGRKAA